MTHIIICNFRRILSHFTIGVFSLISIHVIYIHYYNISYSIGSNTYTIPKTETHRDLGITISSNLSWEPHHHHTLDTAFKVLGLLLRTFSTNININCKKTIIYFSCLVTINILQFMDYHHCATQISWSLPLFKNLCHVISIRLFLT